MRATTASASAFAVLDIDPFAVPGHQENPRNNAESVAFARPPPNRGGTNELGGAIEGPMLHEMTRLMPDIGGQ